MAHYKRRSRSRDKRSMLSCGCCEDIRGGRALPKIDESEICNGKTKKKARKTKKVHEPPCPYGYHEWYEEVVTTPDMTYVCPHDIERGFCFSWRRCNCSILSKDYTKVRFNSYTHKMTCINCWKVKLIGTWDDNPYSYRNRKRSDWRKGSRWEPKRKIRTQDLVTGRTVAVR